ncbi:hypothetical protein F3Y22_tig00109972pilonHSYRG00046 [Hibiscus syriacus]|uniref:Arginine biosynthesis bifunctional protein ArgJ n=1 Tax=Hibiscus syriacus TaxID=106335 RepID=A0A6A3BW29_HIBSY|nr:hypothetical protein F3Y22_tig00109972pilonHSYRG00046 [Hibiscus syriacus]
MATTPLEVSESSNYIPAATILLPDGVWKRIPGGVTAAKGFKATSLCGGLRAKGEKPDLALVTCDVDANVAGAFTTNVEATDGEGELVAIFLHYQTTSFPSTRHSSSPTQQAKLKTS